MPAEDRSAENMAPPPSPSGLSQDFDPDQENREVDFGELAPQDVDIDAFLRNPQMNVNNWANPWVAPFAVFNPVNPVNPMMLVNDPYPGGDTVVADYYPQADSNLTVTLNDDNFILPNSVYQPPVENFLDQAYPGGDTVMADYFPQAGSNLTVTSNEYNFPLPNSGYQPPAEFYVEQGEGWSPTSLVSDHVMDPTSFLPSPPRPPTMTEPSPFWDIPPFELPDPSMVTEANNSFWSFPVLDLPHPLMVDEASSNYWNLPALDFTYLSAVDGSTPEVFSGDVDETMSDVPFSDHSDMNAAAEDVPVPEDVHVTDNVGNVGNVGNVSNSPPVTRAIDAEMIDQPEEPPSTEALFQQSLQSLQSIFDDNDAEMARLYEDVLRAELGRAVDAEMDLLREEDLRAELAPPQALESVPRATDAEMVQQREQLLRAGIPLPPALRSTPGAVRSRRWRAKRESERNSIERRETLAYYASTAPNVPTSAQFWPTNPPVYDRESSNDPQEPQTQGE